MARRYAAAGTAAVGTDKTIINLTGVTTTRGWCYDILVGSDASPLDLAGNFVVMRCTTAGTPGSTPTPAALDPINPAALLVARSGTFGAEPSYTASSELLQFGLNMRATFRWVASPGGELVIPNTASAGIGLKTTAYTGAATMRATFHWEE